jgi:23S rRNA (pseudouridine1915-N3)-methyltransferase
MFIGKTDQEYLREGISNYEKRIQRYLPFRMVTIPGIRKSRLSHEETKKAEAALILSRIRKEEYLVLLDESGNAMTSVDFSNFIQTKMTHDRRDLVFLIGGAYGFHQDLYRRADALLSLSKMTFSHQLVRLLFLEQLYRALTIIKGEPYHHG